MQKDHVDVLIVGAGISGIGMAVHLSEKCPNKSYTIIERRDDIGGTWSLFQYPGIRSDSDMHTLGYSFEPWTEQKSVLATKCYPPTGRVKMHFGQLILKNLMAVKSKFVQISSSWVQVIMIMTNPIMRKLMD